MSYTNANYDYQYIRSSEWELVGYSVKVVNYSLNREFEASMFIFSIDIYRYGLYYVFYVWSKAELFSSADERTSISVS